MVALVVIKLSVAMEKLRRDGANGKWRESLGIQR